MKVQIVEGEQPKWHFGVERDLRTPREVYGTLTRIVHSRDCRCLIIVDQHGKKRVLLQA
jgi:hypothetical protein